MNEKINVYDTDGNLIEDDIGYDFSTSKPIEDDIGYDFSTSRPVGNPERVTSFVEETDQVVEAPEGFFDSVNRIWNQGYEKGNESLELNHLYMRQLFGEHPSPQLKARREFLQNKLQKEVKTRGYHQEILRAFAEQSPQLLEMADKTATRTIQGGLIFGGAAAIAGQAGPQIATPEEIVTVPTATLLGLGVGARLGFAEHSFLQNSAEAFGEFSEFEDKFGNSMDEDLARFGAFMVGAANAGLDSISFKAAGKLFLGNNKYFNFLSKQGKSLKLESPSVMKRIIKDYATAVGVEGVTEALQEGVKDVGGELLKLISDQDFESKTATEIFSNMAAAGDEAIKVAIPLAGAGAIGRTGIEVSKNRARRAERQRKEQDIKKLTDTIQVVSEEGVEGTDSSITSVVGRKMVEGEQLSEADSLVAEDILLESKLRLAREENAPIEAIRLQQKRLQDKQVIALKNDIDDLRINVLREINELQQQKDVVDPDTRTLLEDAATLLKQRRSITKPTRLSDFLAKEGGVRDEGGELSSIGINPRRKLRNDKEGMALDEAALRAFEAGYFSERPTISEFLEALSNDFKGDSPVVSQNETAAAIELDVINDTLSKIDTELVKRGIGSDFRGRLKTLRDRVKKNKQLDKRINRTTKQVEKRLNRLQAQKRRVEDNPPILLADKLKTFKQGLRKGKVLQRKETKTVQDALINIIDGSNLEAKDKAKFIRTVKNIQTIEQFEAQADLIIARARQLQERTRRSRARTRLRKLLLQKKIKPTRQSGKPKGKFTPEIHETLRIVRENVNKKPETAALELAAKEGEGIPSPSEALANKALAIASGEDITAKDMEDFIVDIELLMKEGRVVNKNSILARQDEIAGLKLKTASLLNNTIEKKHGTGPIDENTFRRRIHRLIQNTRAAFDGWVYGWYDLVDVVLLGDKELVNRLRIGANVSQEKSLIRTYTERMQTEGMKAFDLTSERKFLQQMERDADIENLGEFINARGDTVLLQMTKQEMRKRWMELQDPSLHDTIYGEKGNAYTQEMVDAITRRLTKEDKDFAQRQMDVYQTFYNEVNKVYKKVYQVNLPFNEHYSPISREIDSEFNTDEFLNDINYRRSVSPGSLKSRVENIRALRQTSDIATFQRHIAEMAHFIAFAEKVQEINGVFGDAGIRKLIETQFSKEFVNITDKYREAIMKNGADKADLIGRIINTLNRNFSISVLGAKVALAPKQLTSFLTGWENMSMVDFGAGVADFAINPAKAIRILGESELMKARGASISHDIASIGKAVDWKIIRKKKKIDDFLLIPTKIGDRGAIYVSGWAVYRNAIKKGATHEQAIAKFEEMVATTQQSADIDQLSRVQLENPLVRTFTMFLSAPAAYMRATTRAIRHGWRKQIPKHIAAKKILLYHVVIPSFFQFIANGFEWDDDKQLRAAVFGNLNGVFILGDLIQRAMSSGFSPSDPHFAAWLGPLGKGLGELFSAASDFDITEKEFLEAIDDIAEGAGRAIGVPVDAIEGYVDGIQYFRKGKTKEGTLRFLGWPPSVTKTKKRNKELSTL